jgi:cytochrome c553
MKILISLALAGVLSAAAFAADNPEWAYPPIVRPTAPLDNTVMKTVPGSTQQYTQAQIDDPFNPPDWFPGDHPPLPAAVAHGGPKPDGRACGLCHLPTGNGHPESANVAGLPADYIRRQMALFKNGQRAGSSAGAMIAIAQAVSDANVVAAADYFAMLKPTQGYGKLVETDTVAKSSVGTGGMRYPDKDGGTEPLGDRIIPLPDDATAALLRNPHFGFTYYAPKGSVAKGQALVTDGGGGKTIACRLCHGLDLKGQGQVPPIAGRSPTYLFRQLNDIKEGLRNGVGISFMRPVVANLDQNDMIAVAAYLQSLNP